MLDLHFKTSNVPLITLKRHLFIEVASCILLKPERYSYFPLERYSKSLICIEFGTWKVLYRGIYNYNFETSVVKVRIAIGLIYDLVF